MEVLQAHVVHWEEPTRGAVLGTHVAKWLPWGEGRGRKGEREGEAEKQAVKHHVHVVKTSSL